MKRLLKSEAMAVLFAAMAAAAWADDAPATNRVGLLLSVAGSGQPPADAVEVPLAFPGFTNITLTAPTPSWVAFDSIEFDVNWPAGAPTQAQVLVYVQDWDYFWYQHLLPGTLVPGRTNTLRVGLSPAHAAIWKADGHKGVWNRRSLMDPKLAGLRVFSSAAYTGTCRIARSAAVPTPPDPTPPFIRHVVANSNSIPCFNKFELTFALPDRYPNPFDPAAVAVQATFESPTGDAIPVDGFYATDYYVEVDATGERLQPQGPPAWKVRFSPSVEGAYRYTITVRDPQGQATWGPGRFQATAAVSHGFIRVSTVDPRRMETSDGAFYFAIGHNTRSPFDTRLDRQFPWKQRWPEGFRAYERYFRDMRRHGENFAEVWTAAWSLGLEWTPKWYGYHGIGQYNLLNAWQLDKVFDTAERNAINLNLVIHNHGKFSAFSDEEWAFNPFNTKNGGYLQTPDDFFTDPRAFEDYTRLIRYMVARWGYSSHLFAWELWSELDLTGEKRDPPNFQRQEVVDWHRRMGGILKQLDPYNHVVSTHVSGDYNRQNHDIVKLPEMDVSAVDAYHGSQDPLHIVELIRGTAEHNLEFKKPVIVTEFGGSAQAQGIKHLEESLHAALWASTVTPLAGTPMFWWWQLVEEEGFYPEFLAVQRFMEGEDLRDPTLKPDTARVTMPDDFKEKVRALTLKNRTRALVWVFRASDYTEVDPRGKPVTQDAVVRISDLDDGDYAVEFMDTLSGERVGTARLSTEEGALKIAIPAFARDLAFKVRRAAR